MRAKKLERYNLPPINIVASDEELRSLATAIILRAVSDYEQILIDLEAPEKEYRKYRLMDDKKEIETFFNSEWCENLISFAFKEDLEFETGDIKAIVLKRIKEAKDEDKRLFRRRKPSN